MGRRAAVTRIGTRKLSREDEHALAEFYCASGFTEHTRHRKVCNKNDRRRWLREFREEVRVAHDAMLSEDRGLAMHVLTRLVLLDDAIMLCSHGVRFEEWSGHWDTDYLIHECVALLNDDISRSVFQALANTPKVTPDVAGIAKLYAALEEAYERSSPDKATGADLDAIAQLYGVVRRGAITPEAIPDLLVEDGDFVMESDTELRQRILQRLQTHRGGWFMDPADSELGVPYFNTR